MARRVALLAALAVAAGVPGTAGASDRHPLVPDQAKLQLAGSIGLLSTGGGWALWGRRVELDLLMGWVPRRFVGTDHVTFTGKVTWLPLALRLPRWELRLRPLTVAIGVTHTWGTNLWVRHPSRYPSGYYPVPTALRATFAAGGTLGRPAGALRELGVYWELVAGDVPLLHWIKNARTVEATDVFSLAIGARAEF